MRINILKIKYLTKYLFIIYSTKILIIIINYYIRLVNISKWLYSLIYFHKLPDRLKKSVGWTLISVIFNYFYIVIRYQCHYILFSYPEKSTINITEYFLIILYRAILFICYTSGSFLIICDILKPA